MGWSWAKDFFNTRLGRIIMGIIKISLTGFVIQVLNLINLGPDPVIGGSTIPINTIFNLLKAFAGILMIISALRDLDIL